MSEYVITETGAPASLDPLNADSTQNLPVARMIYLTPLEIDATDSIQSLILEKFEYQPTSRKIIWVVKKGMRYSDGTEISTEDVAFAVARMAYARPKFPVIELIEGLSEWVAKKDALSSFPRGIEIDGQKIVISLSAPHIHPLFRFCLELFSIIPKSCVDLTSNKIKCAQIPESGRYSIAQKNSDSIVFKRRLSVETPEQMTFKYIPSARLVNSLDAISENAVIAGNEVLFNTEEMKNVRKQASFYFLPASRFAAFEINPGSSPFADKTCRQVFAAQFRKEFEGVAKDFLPVESSIFTKILSGYVSKKDLEAPSFSRLKSAEVEKCIQKFKSAGIGWGYLADEDTSAFTKTMENVFSSWKIAAKPKVFANRAEQIAAFSAGEIQLINVSSGFWANDPVGDLQMLFTPNLHEILKPTTKDENLQKLIRDLVANQETKGKFFAVNQYLHDESILNVYTHVRRFFFSKSTSRLRQIPQGAAAPTPWQVFQ